MLSYYPQLDLIKVNCTPDFLCNAEMILTCCLPFSAISRMEKQVNRRRVEHDAFTVEEFARDKQQRDAVLSGAAGVTGEDFGYAENHHVRS